MSQFDADLAREAASLTTDPSRLKTLAKNALLAPVIASNPSCPIDLLNELAAFCPSQVLINPLVVSMLEGSKYGVESFLDLRALLAIMVAHGRDTPESAINIAKACFFEACEDACPNINIIRTEEWLYGRSFSASCDELE
jgi:hypothetical protein